MKELRCKTLPSGKRVVTLELGANELLLPIQVDSHYRLGDPLGDVIASHILLNADEVTWCSVEQKWVS